MVAEDGIFGEREIEQQAAPVPVFGNVREAEFAARARIEPRDVAPLELDRARQGMSRRGQS
ncbi:MAG TPA: hypothetical protein VEY11_10840, partial [Pyrinomonadaceae bacterium]|nr:hypothetical protein [Pyrinomonadaceae bacterium]